MQRRACTHAFAAARQHACIASSVARVRVRARVGAVLTLCNALPLCWHAQDDEIEHVKTMHACQDTKRIAADLASRRQKAIAN